MVTEMSEVIGIWVWKQLELVCVEDVNAVLVNLWCYIGACQGRRLDFSLGHLCVSSSLLSVLSDFHITFCFFHSIMNTKPRKIRYGTP